MHYYLIITNLIPWFIDSAQWLPLMFINVGSTLYAIRNFGVIFKPKLCRGLIIAGCVVSVLITLVFKKDHLQLIFMSLGLAASSLITMNLNDTRYVYIVREEGEEEV